MAGNERCSSGSRSRGRDTTRGRAIVGVAAVVLGYAGLAALLERSPYAVPRLCPFHLMTGLPCPLCGLTRAIGLCSRGHVREAVRRYPVPMFGSLVGLALTVARLRAIGKEF
jgi:hypothetical protein